MGRLATDWSVTAESGLAGYLREIWRFPVLEPHEEYGLAKRWREHGDHEAAHKKAVKNRVAAIETPAPLPVH
jgi:RNA polymerase sigma-32 factor